MMAGRVTEFAKKRFEEGDKNVAQYLAQVKAQVAQDLQEKNTGKEKAQQAQKTTTSVKSLVNNKQTVSDKI